MIKIEIEVVDVEGELLFKTRPPQREVLFDLLDARSFDGGTLMISRDGQQVSKTEAIGEYGTHAATTCFIGLSETFAGPFGVTNAVIAEDFQSGDLLDLEIPSLDKNYDLGKDLFRDFRINRAMDKMPIGEAMPVGDFLGKLRDGLTAEVDLTPPSVIRLRHYPNE